jgi:shikimate kinase
MKIFLIGMPGSGKTTLGKQLATHLMLDFVDLDSEIEKFEQKAIREIFQQKGEDHFRFVEARLLREWAGGRNNFIMATGGGAPCFLNGIETINEYGVSIFLDVPITVLIERVKENKERPLLLAADEKVLKDKLEKLRTQRLACYRRATVTVENPSLELLLKKINAKS